MRSGVIAQKLGMTRIFTEAGEHIPATVLKIDGCQVVAHRTKEQNGYTALQLGIGRTKVKNVSKAERERFARASVEPKMKIAEFRVDEDKLEKVLGEVMDLSPRGIRQHLSLNRPIYARTAAYGHFGRAPEADGGFSWERTDLGDAIRDALNGH